MAAHSPAALTNESGIYTSAKKICLSLRRITSIDAGRLPDSSVGRPVLSSSLQPSGPPPSLIPAGGPPPSSPLLAPVLACRRHMVALGF